MVTAVSAVPGMEHSAASTSVPIGGGFGRLKLGTPAVPDAGEVALFNFVSPGWFATYGTPFVEGRDFDGRDSSTAAPVVIVNETLARALFSGSDPIGERLVGGPSNWPSRIVVGVVRDAVFHSTRISRQAGAALRDPVAPTMYLPLEQAERLTPPGMSQITLGVRSAGSPLRLASSAGVSLTSVDPDLSFSFRPLADVVSEAFARERLVAMLSGVFGLVALFLAGMGLYGVSASAVSRRRTEIGVRIALGAAPQSVVRLILRRVAILTALGIVEGVVLSWWVLQVVSSRLFGLSPDDPATRLAAILIISAIALAAAWFPPWRAGRIEPVEVLGQN
jgi:putative ABC transport system permease protein